jgi:hypothetical protein
LIGLSGKFKIYFESISNEKGEMKTRWLNEFPNENKSRKKKQKIGHNLALSHVEHGLPFSPISFSPYPRF